MKIDPGIKELINELISNPIGFTDEQLNDLICHEEFSNQHLTYIFRRIYDLNEGSILNKSSADKGLIGILNRRSQRKRNALFFKKIKQEFKSNPANKIILAEGDSWFEYPLFIREIIDQLIKSRKNDYAIYSLAYGADWLANMIYENEYIEELQLISPDVFLISGGGNDLAGGMRIAKMVETPINNQTASSEFHKCRADRTLTHQSNSKVDFDCDKFELGVKFLNKEFYGLLKAFKIQYTLLLQNLKINTTKFSDLKIITQGYDYGIPSFKLGFGLNPFKAHKPITNYFMKNGKWLKMPLLIKGITDQKAQEAIIYAMIFEFNEMLVNVTAGYKHKNVYHIDCRGLNDKDSWYNELHPESRKFKKISAAYERCIDGKETDNHIIVKHLDLKV